jgi:chromosome segregation ATPase
MKKKKIKSKLEKTNRKLNKAKSRLEDVRNELAAMEKRLQEISPLEAGIKHNVAGSDGLANGLSSADGDLQSSAASN